MNLNELKSNWQNSGTAKKSISEIEMMTKISNHPKIRRISIKLLIEVILLAAFLIFYNDIFDGSNKPLWVNVLLVASAVFFILNDVLGLIYLVNPVKENNLRHSLHHLYSILKRMALFSIFSSLFFGISVILFFTSTIDFTTSKYVMLAGMLVTMLVMVFLSYQNWMYRINQVKATQMEFEAD